MKHNYIGTAPALERGLELIEYISAKDEVVSFTELETLGIPKSTLNRLLTVLCGMSYLEKSAKGYSPGAKCNICGKANSTMEQLRLHGDGIVTQLCRETSNTCLLFYWNGSHTQVVLKHMDSNSLSMQPEGNISTDFVNPPWGWILLEADNITPNIPEKHKDFMATKQYQSKMSFFRENAYAVDHQNHCIRLAAPVFCNQQIVGAIGLGGTPFTIPEEKIGTYGKLLADAAKKLSGLIKN